MIYYTSDLHLRHEKVAGARGFSTTIEHDQKLMENWASVVKPSDTVWVLGDLAVSSGKINDALAMIQDLPGTKRLVLGNHDQAHPMHYRSHSWQSRYLSAFDSVQVSATRRHEGHKLLLSHFPYDGDHTNKDRHPQWRLPDMGTPLAHGHTHSAKLLSTSRKGTLQIHVGVDCWGLFPISEVVVNRLCKESVSVARKFRYIGTDGSMRYRSGRTYAGQVLERGEYLWFKPESSFKQEVPYGSIRKLLQNWQPVHDWPAIDQVH